MDPTHIKNKQVNKTYMEAAYGERTAQGSPAEVSSRAREKTGPGLGLSSLRRWAHFQGRSQASSRMYRLEPRGRDRFSGTIGCEGLFAAVRPDVHSARGGR